MCILYRYISYDAVRYESDIDMAKY